MNPVDEMDDLLRRAGARWRADQEPPPEPDLEHIVHGKRKSWIPALAAATVALIVAGALVVLPNHNAPTASSTTAPDKAKGGATPQSFGQATSNQSLLVNPGDRVQASGLVIAAPGKAPVLCTVDSRLDVGYPPGQEPAPTCAAEFAVTLHGVDLDRLSDPKTTKGVRTGRAKVTGIWGDRSIEVLEQAPPDTPVRWTFPKLPCAAPAGGWVSKPSNINAPVVTAFLAAHSDQIFGPVIHYPNGMSRNAPVVIMVGVAHGDLAAFRQAFDKVYSGNLCVAPVLLSRADNNRIVKAVNGLLSRGKALGILGTGGSDPDGGRANISVIAYTPQVRTALAPIGLDDLQIMPVVKPAG